MAKGHGAQDAAEAEAGAVSGWWAGIEAAEVNDV